MYVELDGWILSLVYNQPNRRLFIRFVALSFVFSLWLYFMSFAQYRYELFLYFLRVHVSRVFARQQRCRNGNSSLQSASFTPLRMRHSKGDAGIYSSQ